MQVAAVPLFIAAIFFAIAIWSPDWLASQGRRTKLLGSRNTFIVLATVVYVVIRVWLTHPAASSAYRNWLAATPWRFPDVLPMGSVTPQPLDVASFAVFTALLIWSGAHPLVGPIVFVTVYAGALTVPLFGANAAGWAHASLALLGLALRVHQWPWACLVVISFALAVAWIGTRRALERFPWTAFSEWAQAIYKATNQTRSETPIPANAGWPIETLLGPARIKPISIRAATVLAAQSGWWSYLGIQLMLEGFRLSSRDAVASFFPLAFGVMFFPSFARFVNYNLGHPMPLSLWGRIWLLKLLMPQYDRVHVAPLAAGVGGGATAAIGFALHGPLDVVIGLSAAVAIWLAMTLGPTYDVWRLTGMAKVAPHRLGEKHADRTAPI